MAKHNTELGEWIKEGLKARGENQAWLAEKIGVKPPQISRIISGTSDTTPEMLMAIADALGKPRSQAFRAAGYIEKTPDTKKIEDEILHKAKKLDNEDRQTLLEFINMLDRLRSRKDKSK